MFALMNDAADIVDISASAKAKEALKDCKDGQAVTLITTGILKRNKKDGSVKICPSEAEYEEPETSDDEDGEGEQPKSGPTGLDYVLAKQSGK